MARGKRAAGVGSHHQLPSGPASSKVVGERRCCACRARRPRQQLARFARSASGTVVFDPAGSAPGRGGYVCRSITCLDTALARGSLARALKISLEADQLAALRRQCVGYLGVDNEH